MPYLLRGDGENRKYFDHYLHDDISHSGRWRHFRVRLETLEKTLDAHKDVNEYIVVRIYIFSRLTYTSVIITVGERSRTIRTVRRMPIPENTTFAGEST